MKQLFTILLLITGISVSGQTMLVTRQKITIDPLVQLLKNNVAGADTLLKRKMTESAQSKDTVMYNLCKRMKRHIYDDIRLIERKLTTTKTEIDEVDSLMTIENIKALDFQIKAIDSIMNTDQKGLYIDISKLKRERNALKNKQNQHKWDSKNWVHKPKDTHITTVPYYERIN